MELVSSLLLSCIDYCNSLLSGLPAPSVHSLCSIQNWAASLTWRPPRWEPTLMSHERCWWLPWWETLMTDYTVPVLRAHFFLPIHIIYIYTPGQWTLITKCHPSAKVTSLLMKHVCFCLLTVKLCQFYFEFSSWDLWVMVGRTGCTKHVQCHGPLIAEWDWKYKTCHVRAHQLLSGTGGVKRVKCHGPLIAEWDWKYKMCQMSWLTNCWVGLEVQNMSNVMAHWLLSGTGSTKHVRSHGLLIAYIASWIFDTKSTCLHHLRNVIRGCWSSYTSYDPWQCFVTFSPANHHS